MSGRSQPRAKPPGDRIRDAEVVDWQIGPMITVSEVGFDGASGRVFETASFEVDPMLVSTGGVTCWIGVGCTQMCDYKHEAGFAGGGAGSPGAALVFEGNGDTASFELSTL